MGGQGVEYAKTLVTEARLAQCNDFWCTPQYRPSYNSILEKLGIYPSVAQI